jgi:hypothetical protein
MVRGWFSSLFDTCRLLVGHASRSGVSFRLPAVFENLKTKISFFFFISFSLFYFSALLLSSLGFPFSGEFSCFSSFSDLGFFGDAGSFA